MSTEELPPLKGIQKALSSITETLAQELAHPTADAPNWSVSEWRIARAVAVLHGVSSLLSRRLNWLGPADWAEFLAEQRLHTESRHFRITDLLRTVDCEARAGAIAFVALKGGALHEAGFYEAGERPMADLDLLVAPADLESMTRVLQGIDYHVTAVTWKHRVFEAAAVAPPAPFGENVRNGIKIDLHTRIRELLPRRAVDVSSLILPLQPESGLNPYRSNPSLMVHLLLHAAGAMLSRTLRSVQLHDIALLAARMSKADWDEWLALSAAMEGHRWALAPLTLVARYYGNLTIPAQVLAIAAAGCPSSLVCRFHRTALWEVSYSNLRRSAFPGLRWSASIGEALAYVAERILVGTRALVHDARLTSSLDPYESRAATRKLPRLRWVGLRPVRPATLNAVRYALAQ
jgi:Uncharacterised nucleotidyltransferase